MKGDYIPVITRDKSIRVKVSDVVMIERANRKLKVITDNSEYEIYEKIDKVRDMLDDRFYPCLSGCIINMDKVSSMEKMTINFDGGRKIIIGRDSYIRTRQAFNARMRRAYGKTTE